VWDQVQQLKAKSRRQDPDPVRGHERVPMRVYAAMLRLCLGKGEKKLYQEVWDEATRAHRASAHVIARMVKDQMGLASASQPAASEAEPAVVADDKEQPDSTLRAAFCRNCEHRNEDQCTNRHVKRISSGTIFTGLCRPAMSSSSMRLPSGRCTYVDESCGVYQILVSF
jgi:hypothetical protein